MRNIGNNILVILLITLISSCGVFNKVFKRSNKYKEISAVTLNKDTEINTTDKSTTTIEESADTTLYTKGRKDKSIVPVRDIKDINDLTLFSNDLFEVKTTYDTLGKTLITDINLKPQAVDFKHKKKTTIVNDIVTNTKVSTDSVANKEIKAKEKYKEKKPANAIWLVVLGIGVLATLYFITKVFKK